MLVEQIQACSGGCRIFLAWNAIKIDQRVDGYVEPYPDHLVFGVGTAVFSHVYRQYSPRGNSMAFAHNFFLQALAEYGIPGLVL